MGFDAWFFGRIDYQDRDKRNREKNLEFITKMPYDRDLLSHVLYLDYSSPLGFNFD